MWHNIVEPQRPGDNLPAVTQDAAYTGAHFVTPLFIPEKIHCVSRFVHPWWQFYYLCGTAHCFLSTLLEPSRGSYNRIPAPRPAATLAFFSLALKGLAMARPLKLPTVVGIRLAQTDVVKLQRLCAATQRPASELFRLLLRLATANERD
jgi:hypothetical protein